MIENDLIGDTSTVLDRGFREVAKDYRAFCRTADRYTIGVFVRVRKKQWRDMDRLERFISKADFVRFHEWLFDTRLPLGSIGPRDAAKLAISFLDRIDADVIHDTWVTEKGDLDEWAKTEG
ncbi:MAG: hypothetical protein JKY67_00310 [Pseudomonadales bacterium]|nr:hypothetical protein [Pseudomonadales bacterium]